MAGAGEEATVVVTRDGRGETQRSEPSWAVGKNGSQGGTDSREPSGAVETNGGQGGTESSEPRATPETRRSAELGLRRPGERGSTLSAVVKPGKARTPWVERNTLLLAAEAASMVEPASTRKEVS